MNIKENSPRLFAPLLFMLWNGAVGRVIGDVGGVEFPNCSGKPESAGSVGNQTVGNNSRCQV